MITTGKENQDSLEPFETVFENQEASKPDLHKW